MKKNTFQGLVMQLPDLSQVPQLLPNMKQVPRLRKFQCFPHALRIRQAATLSSNGNSGSDGDPEAAEELQRTKTQCPCVSEDPGLFESWEDDGEMGVGDRLLHLLQRWQVENVVLLVARQDDSLCGRLIGAELFKLMIEAAKLALEQYYMENAKPSDAAKMELMATAPTCTPGGPYQPLSARRREDEDGTHLHHQQQQHAAVCLMTSDTIPSWPVNHQATPDGGGRKGVRQGRINHFLNRKTTTNGSKPTKPKETQANNTALSVGMNQEDSQQELGDTSDITRASGGIEWLKISRDELLKLKSIRVPVKELHFLFMCLVILLEKPHERVIKAKPTQKMHEEFTPANFSWLKCREILHQSHDWSGRLRDLHGSKLVKSQVTALRAIFQEPSFSEDAFIRISVASVKIFSWLQRLLDEYDEMELGLRDHTSPQVPLPGLDPPVLHASVSSSPPKSPRPKQKLHPRPPPPSSSSPVSHDKDEQLLTKEFHGLIGSAAKPSVMKIVDRGRLFSNATK